MKLASAIESEEYDDNKPYRYPYPLSFGRRNGNIFFRSDSMLRCSSPGGALFSIGIHPWNIDSDKTDSAMNCILTAPAIAIGEIGLDYSKQIDRRRQKEIFIRQLDIADRRNLPVIIHCVKAYNDILSILGSHPVRDVIFHGYIGSPQQTELLIEKGYYLSVSNRSFASPKTVESLRRTSLARIFCETDDSCGGIGNIYSQLSEIKGVDIGELKEIIKSNYKTIFG